MEEEENFQPFEQRDAKFRHPFTMTVSGSTGSGKSEWVAKLLNNLGTLLTERVELVLYCYGALNANVMQLQKSGLVGGGGGGKGTRVIIHPGVPGEELVQKRAMQTGGKLLLVLDDLMVGIGQQFLDAIFTRGSHHWGVSVVLITQHLFSRELRIARNNSHYLVLMRNPSGALQIRTLATHLFPGRSAYFMEAYANATEKQFGYLVVDMHPESPEMLRLKTNIYGEGDGGGATVVYIPK